MDKLYYIELDGQRYGAYTLDQVKQFGLFADTLVFTNDIDGWLPASEYAELAESLTPLVEEATLDIFNVAYYYKENEQLYGPLSILELVYLDINGNTSLGINSTENWSHAGNVPNLMDTLARLSALEKDEHEAELRKIRDELALSTQELHEVIEEQEAELEELKRRLNSNTATEEDVSKESMLAEINRFKERLAQQGRDNFSKIYPSYSNELLDSVDKYGRLADQFIVMLNSLSDKSQKWMEQSGKNHRDKNEIISAIRNLAEQVHKHNPAPSPNFYETAECGGLAWNELRSQPHRSPASSLLTGKNVIDFTIFDDLFSFTKNEYATLLDTNNIVAYYDYATRKECFDFVNTLTARLFMSSMPGKFFVTTIDAQEMEGVSDLFKSLNKSVFVYSRENEIQQCLEKRTQYIENVIQNLLLHPIKNIGEYNQGKENPESYHLLIIKAFPVGLTPTSLALLKQIMKNGHRAGVHVILLVDKDELADSDNSKRQFDAFELDKFGGTMLRYDFVNEQYPFSHLPNIQHFNFELLSVPQIQNIVRHVNKSLETQPAEVVPFGNFMPSPEDWWSRQSANMIEIPFGVSEEKELVSLSITQEGGQNSAVVVGIPGSGKSVFLHSIIANAIVNYSPDELELYLMDFSGVEFNTYALYNLPHAKVIAPEAEREFGLSVLKELKAEGARRMELCRENEVRSIVDLRTKCPDLKMPRLLVIIDEFQKLFEIETDSISREAQSIIHIIVKEFRKFGINLILATQKLSDINSSILPKDLIANRVIFKCSPNDIGLIGLNAVPQLRPGECIYNAESGVPSANKKVQTFFITKREIDELLTRVKSFGDAHSYAPKNLITFRSDERPEFRMPNVAQQAQPDEVDVYFGQPIAISENDVCAALRKSSNDNILIIGGEQDVAQKLAINSTMSAMAQYPDRAAKWYIFNFMRPSDPLASIPAGYFGTDVFDTVFASKAAEVSESLREIKMEIDARKADEDRKQQHIYLSLYAFQLAQMFKKGGRRGDDVSEDGQLLGNILNNGPLVGVFTILQVDNVPNLQHLGDVVGQFTHRVALQMDERDSNKVVGSDIASRLYVMNRPSSKYRAYYFDNRNRVTVKFKPYK